MSAEGHNINCCDTCGEQYCVECSQADDPETFCGAECEVTDNTVVPYGDSYVRRVN